MNLSHDDFRSLQKTLMQVIDPTGFQEKTGLTTDKISIASFQSKLIITTSSANQLRVRTTLQELLSG